MTAPLLEVTDLRTHFVTRRGVVKAVDGVSFSVAPGETLGIVGESGSGKSMTALSIMRLVPKPAGRIVSGAIRFDGIDLVRAGERELRRIRGRRIAIIFQDPMSSLNPLFTVGEQVAEPLRRHRGLRGRTLWDKVAESLAMVGIGAPAERMAQYPHQMSGGMRQRIVGAIGLSCAPQLLIADEPTTSLDVTVQAQYLRLLKQLQATFGLALIIITHDLSVVAAMCDRVAVMYAGRVVESATTADLFETPRHPYTVALLRSLPRLDARTARLEAIAGQPPDLGALPAGCAFAPRCPDAMAVCRTTRPPAVALDADRSAECWLHAEHG
jgi:oligopeptide transport system ATP-binding protein